MQDKYDDLKQVGRLRYYGLKLFKFYIDEMLAQDPLIKGEDDLYAFGGKFNAFFEKANKLICHTLAQSYREILNREEGTAFSLPRDANVWELVRRKFSENLALLRL